MNFLTDSKQDPRERKLMVDFWEKRYTNTPPVMTPDASSSLHLQDKWPKCGDEGLKLPWHEHKTQSPNYEQIGQWLGEMSARHRGIEGTMSRFDMPAQDKERLALTVKTEKAAYASWEAPDKNNTIEGKRADKAYREAFGNLMVHDRAVGHPISDPTRDLHSDPVTLKEQTAWMRRDGREISGNERSYEQTSDLYESHARAAPGRQSTEGDWYRPGPNAAVESSKPGEQLNGPEMMQQGRESSQWIAQHVEGRELTNGPAMKELLEQRRKAGIEQQEQKRGGRTL